MDSDIRVPLSSGIKTNSNFLAFERFQATVVLVGTTKMAVFMAWDNCECAAKM